MTKKILGAVLLLLTLVASQSCDLINPQEELPGFIKIDSIQLSTSENEGTSASNITEAWVYLNGKQQGVYDLPVVLPVLEKGTFEIEVRAGVKKDGLGSTRVRYPFLDSYSTTAEIKELDTLKISPVVKYFEAISIWEENFEDPGIQLDKLEDYNADFSLTYDDTEVFEGTASGKIVLEDTIQTFGFRTSVDFNFKSGVASFLELNYKTDEDFEVGIIANEVPFRALYVRAKKDALGLAVWNKIYINLSELVASNATSSQFDVYIKWESITESKKTYLFDNIKVVYQ